MLFIDETVESHNRIVVMNGATEIFQSPSFAIPFWEIG
jgi:hypothetical protein